MDNRETVELRSSDPTYGLAGKDSYHSLNKMRLYLILLYANMITILYK